MPLPQVPFQPFNEAQTPQLLEAIVGERRETGKAVPTSAGSERALASGTPLVGLGDVLFARTGGQPLYLLETLKLLRERQWLLPQLDADGSWRLEPTGEIAPGLPQERSPRRTVRAPRA